VLPSFKALLDRERRLARAYWTLAQCNRALVRATGEPDLLNQLCKLLVQVGEYRMAWVGFAEDDAEQTVRCVAQAGFSDGYLESVRITWADDAHGRGPTGTCIRTGKPVVNRNSQTEPTFEPWRAQAMERGFQSSISLPLVLAKRSIGALTVYSSRTDAFDPDEQELMLRLSEDLAFGIGALRDREERERAEARLQERESMYRQVVRNFPNGALGLFDRNLRYELIDGEGLADIGQSQASLEGRTNREAFPPEFADAMDPLYRSALEGKPVRVEVPFGEHWFDLHLRPVHDAGGRVVAGFVSSVDITHQKRAQAATAASEELFRSAFEDASVGKALATIDGRYVRVNRALCETFGYAPEELVGKRFGDLTHPDDRAASEEANQRMLAGEQAASLLEKRYVRKDGRIVWADVGVSLVRAPDGSPRYFITDVQDVTMRRLAEEQLRQSQKMEAVGLLAGGIAHDFNNILTGISMSCELALLDEPEDSPGGAPLRDVLALSRRAAHLTRQLLAFSRKQV
jgi:PAS domain S-box-containing protein